MTRPHAEYDNRTRRQDRRDGRHDGRRDDDVFAIDEVPGVLSRRRIALVQLEGLWADLVRISDLDQQRRLHSQGRHEECETRLLDHIDREREIQAELDSLRRIGAPAASIEDRQRELAAARDKRSVAKRELADLKRVIKDLEGKLQGMLETKQAEALKVVGLMDLRTQEYFNSFVEHHPDGDRIRLLAPRSDPSNPQPIFIVDIPAWVNLDYKEFLK